MWPQLVSIAYTGGAKHIGQETSAGCEGLLGGAEGSGASLLLRFWLIPSRIALTVSRFSSWMVWTVLLFDLSVKKKRKKNFFTVILLAWVYTQVFHDFLKTDGKKSLHKNSWNNGLRSGLLITRWI